MAALKLDISRSPQRHFFNDEDPYEDNLKKKAIFFAVLLNFLNKPLFCGWLIDYWRVNHKLFHISSQDDRKSKAFQRLPFVAFADYCIVYIHIHYAVLF